MAIIEMVFAIIGVLFTLSFMAFILFLLIVGASPEKDRS